MKLSEFKEKLNGLSAVNFMQSNGKLVPVHYHITEVGQVSKHFIDCGGTVRDEKLVSFQLWEANDYDHRLSAQKLKDIIALSEKTLGMEDHEIEVEYQNDTIGKFGVDFDGENFLLVNKATACLASDACGTNEPKKVSTKEEACCTPGGGCC